LHLKCKHLPPRIIETQQVEDLGTSKNNIRLKKFGEEAVNPNDIIARQRGFKWKSGNNVIVGKDQTIHAAC